MFICVCFARNMHVEKYKLQWARKHKNLLTDAVQYQGYLNDNNETGVSSCLVIFFLNILQQHNFYYTFRFYSTMWAGQVYFRKNAKSRTYTHAINMFNDDATTTRCTLAVIV